jgi:diguanylate cyclase (GGDEF)-like protein
MSESIIQRRIRIAKGKIPIDSIKAGQNIQGESVLPLIEAQENTEQKPLCPYVSFAQEVFAEMQEKNILATPISFNHFFYKLLQEKDKAFQQQIEFVLEMEKGRYPDDAIEMEKGIRRTHGSIRQLLIASSTIVRGVEYLKKALDSRGCADEKITKVLKILSEKEAQAKKEHENIVSALREIQAISSMNLFYEVYNQNYMIEQIKQEAGLTGNFQRSSSFMLVAIHRDTADRVKNDETKLKIFKKAVASILKKTVRRSDCVGYHDKGFFGIVLPHTNIEEAENLANRIQNSVSHGSVMIGKSIQSIKVAIGITPIFSHQAPKEVLGFCMSGIDNHYREPHRDCGVYLGYCSVKKRKEKPIDLSAIGLPFS